MKNSRFQAAFAKNLRCAQIRAGHSINVNAFDSIIITIQPLLIRYDDRAQHLGSDGAAQMPCLSMHAIHSDADRHTD